MATIETNAELGQQTVDDAKRYVLHSWSVQDALQPIPVAGGEGCWFWDYDGKRYLDFASQLVNVSIGHQHPCRCPAGAPDPCPVCTGAPHLEEILQYEGPQNVAAVILETITGTNGVIPPPDGSLQAIREVCDRHGILLICDEVMAGFGRTGKWFAVEHWDVVPDIITLAKGINSGYVPLGAMVIREPIADWVRSRFFAGGLTYSGHPLACASAVASIEAFQEEGIVENAAATGEVFRTALGKLAEKHPSIGDVRGLGCFWGSELVKNQEAREPRVPFNGTGDHA